MDLRRILNESACVGEGDGILECEGFFLFFLSRVGSMEGV